jgi:hypothetical protein
MIKGIMAFCLLLLCMGCQSQSQAPNTVVASPTETPLAPQQQSNVPTWTPRPTIPPVSPTRTPIPIELLEVPAFYYAYEGEVFRIQAGETTPIGQGFDFSNTGWIKAGNLLYWVDETTLQRMDLQSGEGRSIHTFESRAEGTVIRASHTGRLLFSRSIEDSEAPLGVSGEVWLYDPTNPEPLYITTIQRAFLLVGLSADESSFYTVPLGQDPSFGEIETRNTEDGSVVTTSEVQGEILAMLSPDQTTLLHGSYDCGEHPGDACLSTFGIQGAYGTLLPEQNWNGPQLRHACAIDWRGKQSTIVYILCEGNWYEVPKVYRGLFEWDLSGTQSIALDDRLDSPLALHFQDDTRMIISDEGEWLLAWNFNQPIALAMHLPTKSMVEVILPTPVVVVGWE